MALTIRLKDTLDEALTTLKDQDLEIGPYIDGIMSTADEFARMSKQAISMELAKRALLLSKENPNYTAEQAVREAFANYADKASDAFDTNIRLAYSAGRFKRAEQDEDASKYVLRTMRDKRVRPTHRKLEGVTLPRDDAFWTTHWPPMGYRCRCKAYPVTDEDIQQLKDAGVRVIEKAPPEKTAAYINKYTGQKEKVPASIDPGWLVNGQAPARVPLQAMQQVVNRKQSELMAIYNGTAVDAPPKEKTPSTPPKQLPLQPPSFAWDDFITVKGKVSEDFKKEVKNILETVPERLRQQLLNQGGGVTIADYVTNALPELKGVRPRGWPPGSTWDQVEGLAITGRAYVTERVRSPSGRSAKGRGPHVIMHEVGHALDYLAGQLSESKEFLAAYKADAAKLSRSKKSSALFGYLLQDGVAGPSEAFAELFAGVLQQGMFSKDPEFYRQAWPKSFGYIEKLLENYA